MWLLTNSKSECFYILNEKCQYTVGRVESDLVLLGDASISRLHAFLNVHKNDDSTLRVELQEAGSKYGTFYNGNIANNVRIKKDECVILRSGDKIRFGIKENLWTVSHHRLICLASTLTPSQTETLTNLINLVGGAMLTEFNSNCTHLTMSTFKVTVKALYALLDLIPIVTVDYWHQLLRAARNKAVLPSTADCTPPNNEELLQGVQFSLCARPERKQLFRGLVFVFMNRKQQDIYAPIVVKAGGACKNLKDGVAKTFLNQKGVIVVQYVPSTQSQNSQTFNQIDQYIESLSRRVIPEHEIGLAIVRCSTEQYCNPDYKESVNRPLHIPDTLVVDLFPESIDFSSACVGERLQSDILSQVTVPSTSENEQAQVPNNRKRNIKLCAGTKDANTKMLNCAKKPCLDVSPNPCAKREKNAFKVGTSNDSRLHDPVLAIEEVSSSSSSVANEDAETSAFEATGFLKKRSQAPRSQNNATNPTPVAIPASSGKRTRIAVISNDSDDDDNLFGFADTDTSAKRARSSRYAPNKDSGVGSLFAFTDTSTNTVDESVHIKEALQSVPLQIVDKVQSNCYVNVPIKPIVVSTEGWLSCGRHKQKEEQLSESVVSQVKENLPKNENEKHCKLKDWLDSLKGGFEVRMFKLNLNAPVKKEADELLARSTTGESKGLKSTVSNFKAFVRKHNLHPQKTVIKTIKVPIGGTSML